MTVKNKKRHNLKRARIAAGFKTQDEFAAHLNISLDHVGSLELGRVNPSSSLLFRICNELKQPVEYLFPDLVGESVC